MFVFWGPQLVKIYNDSYRPIVGAKHPWALGRPGPEVWPEIWDTIGPMVDRVVNHGEATWSDDLLLFMERNGFPEEVYFTFSYSPVRDESGGIGGLFCACTETTEKVLGERRLRTLRDLAAQPAEAANAQEACRLSAEIIGNNPLDLPFAALYLDDGKGGFRLAGSSGFDGADLSGMDVRWPLHAVAETLRAERVSLRDVEADDLPPDHRESLELIERNGRRLEKLVNTLLDFSRIEAGRAKASYEPADLAALTRDLVSNFRSACERAGLTLEVDCPPLPELVYVDPDLWEKIVLNLLSNAFKFTWKGGIRVSLRIDGDQATLEVRDSGTGIPASEMSKLFDRFHRIEGSHGRTQEGSGIGLALVQELVRLHGGTISAESEPGRGTTFCVNVPFGRAHLPEDRVVVARARESTSRFAATVLEEARRWVDADAEGSGAGHGESPVDGGTEAQAMILVADDNADMRDYLTRLLGEHHQVIAVADGQKALEVARRASPDLVLTDVMMPCLDGFGLLSALRGSRRTRDIPIILLSARAGEEARLEGLEAGADDYLVKPFSARELSSRVYAQLALAKLRSKTATALREQDRRKNEFLAVLAHELRNPLAPIRSGLELLRLSGDDPATVVKVREMLERQSRQLANLVDDLLDVSRITRGKLELRCSRVALKEIVDGAIETSRPYIEAAGHDLTVDLFGEDVDVYGDPSRLIQVVSNLLTNAAKYTPDGGRVKLSVCRDGGRAVISIADNGIGIDEKMIEHVFEMFGQVRAIDRVHTGLGIGLTLAQRLVQLHGGDIRVKSEGRGLGSEFVVSLPVFAGQTESETELSPDALASASKRRILIVDDNLDAAEMLAAIVEAAGNDVRVAGDGQEALELAGTFRPSAIVMDLGMPRLNGYDAARRLREQPWGREITLVALTGWGQDADKQRAEEAGFDHHLTKPANPQALLAMLTESAEHDGD